ncbi:DNA cytosine methyltransferase (plasmid) [Aneurinibacillus sp. Ricciae_BoGa-3]|uniref:DNA cytosine methyltransferase n=1 Tax=Aneurinibacillus sp. Ricciae_BoGa-3 TaxID=3022697 RepID=UPI002341D14D|nr:DNA cytosine methyltransferase [Aneurinibacillus sp. Ricciae_BoGa-3]WCK57707.1 DNA cytosine methyltransferase [Aneurinibacillus sp. Ricciae_BoGa-3]
MRSLTIKEIEDIPKKRNVVSLFSGFGANTIGYHLAGLDVKVAVDYQSEVGKVYQSNHQKVRFIQKDVKDIKGDELLNECGLEKYELDILDASPPSNFFSKRQNIPFHQRTDSLLLEIGRIIEDIMPKVFVINNDKKLGLGKSQLVLNEMIELLKEIGYRVDFEILNARFYEVPQDKETLFIIGVRKDLRVKPVFPEALEYTISTQDAIEDLMHIPMEYKTNRAREAYITKYFRPGITEEEIEDIMEANDIHVREANYKRDRWEEPYYELKKNFTRPIHPKMDRVLSIWEAMRIQTYPDGYRLSSNPSLNWQKICSSVSPHLMKHIAKVIDNEILDKVL